MAESQSPQPSPQRPGERAKRPVTPATTLYRQGVLAFNQGQYLTALDHFQDLVQRPTVSPELRLKGEMGLIRTQLEVGQIDQARQGCQRVLTSGIPQACRWAESVLVRLPQPSGSAPTPNPVLPLADPTGFVPLDSPPSAEAPTVPRFPHPSENSDRPVSVAGSEVPNTGVMEVGAMDPSQNRLADPLEPDLPKGGESSLFDYRRLNQVITGVSTEDTAAPPHLATTDLEPVPLGPGAPPSTLSPSPPPPAFGLGRPLPQPPYELWVAQMVTALATVWVTITGIHLFLHSLNDGLRQVMRPLGIGGLALLDRTYTVPLLLITLGLMMTSPWWMDYLLARLYGQTPLTTHQLQGQRPVALKLLRQQCQRQGWYLPELRLLPDPVPLCFSYGWRPRHLRLVVSQGLLDSADDEVLATLYTYELAHVINRSTAVIGGLGGLLLGLYSLYDRLGQASYRRSGLPKVALGGLAYLSYGLYWSLRSGLLWISRLRSGWADRQVEALIQRPSLQQRSLQWLAAQLPAHLAQRGTLPSLWWSLDVLMPISPQAALSPGSFRTALGDAATVVNDWANPYRHWLLGRASHPPLGDRLHWLNQRAKARRQPTLDLLTPIADSPPTLAMARLARQKSPLLGVLLGGGLALVFWFVGGIMPQVGWTYLGWWYQDKSLLYGGLLLGLGLGLLVRINPLYPDIPRKQPTVADPTALLGDLDQLPVEGQPCGVTGTLINPSGGPLGADLYLKTLGGVVKLDFSSPQPGLWDLRPTPSPLRQWIGRSVTVTGWRRRSHGIVWIDVATLGLSAQRHILSVAAPIWATMISLGLCLVGIRLIWTGT